MYDFPLNFIPRKDAEVPDTILQTYLNDCKTENSTEDMEARVYFIHELWLTTNKKFNCEKTATDELIKLLTLHVWPKNKKVEPSRKPFSNSGKDISMLDSVLLKGNRIIVLNDQRGEVRNLSRAGHQSIEKCIARASEYVYWSEINAEIKNKVKTAAHVLMSVINSQLKQSCPHEMHEVPWIKIGTGVLKLYKKPLWLLLIIPLSFSTFVI